MNCTIFGRDWMREDQKEWILDERRQNWVSHFPLKYTVYDGGEFVLVNENENIWDGEIPNNLIMPSDAHCWFEEKDFISENEGTLHCWKKFETLNANYKKSTLRDVVMHLANWEIMRLRRPNLNIPKMRIMRICDDNQLKPYECNTYLPKREMAIRSFFGRLAARDIVDLKFNKSHHDFIIKDHDISFDELSCFLQEGHLITNEFILVKSVDMYKMRLKYGSLPCLPMDPLYEILDAIEDDEFAK